MYINLCHFDIIFRTSDEDENGVCVHDDFHGTKAWNSRVEMKKISHYL